MIIIFEIYFQSNNDNNKMFLLPCAPHIHEIEITQSIKILH